MRTLHDDGSPATKDAGLAWNGRDPATPLSQNGHLLKWVEKMARADAARCRPLGGRLARRVRHALCAQMVESGTFIKLNEELWPNCYYARSDPTTSRG